MTTTSALLPLLVAFPLAGALILLLVGRRGDRWGHWLGVLAPTVSFVLAIVLFVQMIGADAEERHTSAKLWDWVATANYHVAFELQLDQLSMCFVLLILGVGSLIHLYSVGYMAHDGRRRRFFAYLNLFVAAMLLLVLAGDYLLLFVGWEGVGLASYLLIGFWQHRPSAATAAKKAFVVNRVGDIGLSLAIMAMIFQFGSSSFAAVNAGADGRHHVAELRDRRIGKHALDVVLHAREDRGQKCGEGADPPDDQQHVGRQREQPAGTVEQVHARGHHGGRMDQRRHGRRTFHGVGQPHVKRELCRFADSAKVNAEGDERQASDR